MQPIHFGLILPQLPAEPALRAAFIDDMHRALALASGHFASVRMIDHLGVEDLESFTTLAYLAGRYPQLQFGHTVICQSFRNPALTAKTAATLQFLSGGRFHFGIGAGWNEPEYRAFGYDFPSAGTRVEQLEEALQIIKALWTGRPVTFMGKHYRVENAVCTPVPDPVPPVMVGAFGPRMLRLTARYADEWNVSSTGVPRYRRLSETFDRACRAEGRDPATVRRSWGNGCVCRLDEDEAKRIAGDRFSADAPEEDFGFVGTPAQIVAQMRPFIDLGVSAFYLDCGGFPDLTTLELLIRQVLPAINP